MLELLAGMEPAWTLTGGGALAGFHFGHRPTRDLDLFWHGERELRELPAEVFRRLEAAGMTITPVRVSPAFRRVKVTDGDESVLLDLVADPVPVIETPEELRPGIHVDTRHEILVNKLCALLSRSEPRDLVDIRELVAHGGDLDRAISEAHRKDGGFSPSVLAWVLNTSAPPAHATLATFREQLIDRLLG